MYLFVLDRRYISVRGVFVFKTLLMEDITSKGSFPFLGGCSMMLTRRWWRSERRIKNLNQNHNRNPNQLKYLNLEVQ